MASSEIAESATKAIEVHGIGSKAPPKSPELWEQFKGHAEVETKHFQIQNRFYAGCKHAELDWSKPVHGLFVDFKGDSMQIGMIVQRLMERGEQFVFVGNPLPFNGGWHFTAVNDFEHPQEQRKLAPSWQDIRIWHCVNYVATISDTGLASLTPKEAFNADNKQANAIPISASFKLSNMYFLGGLMPHTINASAISEGSALSLLIDAHLKLGSTFATVGHGLDVLIACGTPEKSIIYGAEVAVFPNQEHLLEISGMKKSSEGVCRFQLPSGATIVSTGLWSSATSEDWFRHAGLEDIANKAVVGSDKVHMIVTSEPVASLNVEKLPSLSGAVCRFGESQDTVAVFVDEVADPIEIYTTIVGLIDQQLSFHLVSRSCNEQEGEVDLRYVTSETVFGNVMYGLRDCVCVVPTTPANQLPAGSTFDSFFVVGGQCPYHLMGDANVTRVMDSASIAAAVCHGPEALIGSKWLNQESAGNFTAYTGCWMSFRDVLGRFEKKKPGEVVGDSGSTLFSGNAPNATKEMVARACREIKDRRVKTTS